MNNNEKINNIVVGMTLEEKVGQMCQYLLPPDEPILARQTAARGCAPGWPALPHPTGGLTPDSPDITFRKR